MSLLIKSILCKKIECIVEYITDDGVVTARTYKDAPEVDGLIYLTLKNPETDIVPGDIIIATVTKADAYDLYGVIE